MKPESDVEGKSYDHSIILRGKASLGTWSHIAFQESKEAQDVYAQHDTAFIDPRVANELPNDDMLLKLNSKLAFPQDASNMIVPIFRLAALMG